MVCVCSQVRFKREDERPQIRWKLRLRERAILVRARLTEVMLVVGEIVGTIRLRLEGYSCSVGLSFNLGFPT